MKTSLLYIGILSALLMASSSSFARPKRNVEAIARTLRGYHQESASAQYHLFEMVTNIQNRYPVNWFTTSRSVEDVYKEHLKLVRIGQVSSNPLRVLDSLMDVTSTPSISETTAQAIIGILSRKMVPQLSQNQLANLFKVITATRNPEIGRSLHMLAEKVAEKEAENSEGIRPEDIQTIVKFSINTSQITRNTTEGNTPTAENIVLDLAKHGYDMVTWPAEARSNVMDLISKFNTKVGEKSLSAALKLAFVERGFQTVSERNLRKRVIRDKCR